MASRPVRTGRSRSALLSFADPTKMSADLTWMLIRDNSAFLVKRDGAQFSRERGNLTKKNAFKFSGLANTRAVSVTINANKKKPQISLKRASGVGKNQPKHNEAKSLLTKHPANAASAVRKLVQSYRPDLTKYAVARFHAVKKSLAKKPAQPKRERKRRSRKAAAAQSK
jgi:large subunit ribosomal protein L28e